MKPNLHTITSIILDDGHYASLHTIGPSMYPVIRSGDKIYVESLKGRKLEKGDIILFKCAPSPLTLPSGERIKVRGDSPHRGEEESMESSPGGKEVIIVCHRLVRIFEKDGITYYQTRGDAFFHKDAPIIYEQIIGKVIKVERIEISLLRRILLLSPLLGRFTLLNAAIVNALIWIKSVIGKNRK
jgi:hypothetical protein